LRAFEAAARLGSFSAAASELNLTHGAISRQIARLETWLGHRLFERHGRGVSTTLDGRRLQLRAMEAFSLLSEGGDRWLSPRGAAVVRLTAPPALSELWLIPRLSALEAGDPPLHIDLRVESRSVDLGEERIDLALRWGRGRVPGRLSMQLLQDMAYPIASPALAAQVGSGVPERLLQFPILHTGDIGGWRSWFEQSGLDYAPRRQDRRFLEYNILLAAVRAGLGIGLSRPSMIGAALADGSVVQVDERAVPAPGLYWLDRMPGPPRPAAATLARRLAEEAGLSGESCDGFLAATAG
jgi:DNA-binding transcriptional LysR family regulator